MTEQATTRALETAATDGGIKGEGSHGLKRRTYVNMRLADLGEEIKTLAEQRGELSRGIEGRGDDKSEEMRQLRQRRMYVAARLNILRGEQQDLNHERREALTAEKARDPKLKGVAKGGKRQPAASA